MALFAANKVICQKGAGRPGAGKARGGGIGPAGGPLRNNEPGKPEALTHMMNQPNTPGRGPAGPPAPARLTQQQWLRERSYLNAHRHELAQLTQELYPVSWRVAGTPLLARPEWLPATPVPLAAVALSWQPGQYGTVIDPVQPEGSEGVRPLRDDGARFASYADALAGLSRPRLLENRTCYRLLAAAAAATGAAGGQLTFGINRYFDLINVSEAVAHETAARVLARCGRAGAGAGGGGGDGGSVAGRGAESGTPDGMAAPAAAAPLSLTELPLRSRIGHSLDLARRSVTTGIATLILRLDRAAGRAQMFLHWRDPASVAVNGGLYQVAPAGMFQPSHEATWNLANDLGLWEAIAREVSEELLGTSEDYGSGAAPIDYPRWPFFAALAGARRAGTLRGYWLGVGADPLTLDVDLLTVLVFDAPFFDAEFGGLVAANDEGPLLSGPAAPGDGAGIEFSAPNVARFTSVEAMQPAGAALLRLAWQHRGVLLGG